MKNGHVVTSRQRNNTVATARNWLIIRFTQRAGKAEIDLKSWPGSNQPSDVEDINKWWLIAKNVMVSCSTKVGGRGRSMLA